MSSLYFLFGSGEDLQPWQMGIRAVCALLILLVVLRASGSLRIFGKKSTLDNIMIIMLGAVLARGVVGASPFLSTIATAIIMVGVHRLLAYLSVRNKKINHLINGDRIVLYTDGKFIYRNMLKISINRSEIEESLRLETKKTNFEDIEYIFMETNGRLSFIEKSTD